MSPMRVGYDETAAEESWERMLRFFHEHLTPSAEPAPG